MPALPLTGSAIEVSSFERELWLLAEDAGEHRVHCRRILEHLGLWAPIATERSPLLGPANWPRYANLPLTYHPIPDIA